MNGTSRIAGFLVLFLSVAGADLAGQSRQSDVAAPPGGEIGAGNPGANGLGGGLASQGVTQVLATASPGQAFSGGVTLGAGFNSANSSHVVIASVAIAVGPAGGATAEVKAALGGFVYSIALRAGLISLGPDGTTVTFNNEMAAGIVSTQEGGSR